MRTALLVAGLLFGAMATNAQNVDITFRVDMSEFTGTIDASGMHLAGSFATGTWTPSARPMNNDGNGIWSYTESLPAGSELQYKFVLGNDWPSGDENMGGAPCSAPSSSNRLLIVPAATTTLPAVCYNSCNPCAVQALVSDITFQVDMSLQTIDIENGGVGISGTFNGFAKLPMVDQGGGLYAVTISLEQGSTVQYKFRNGDAFENPFGACASGDFGNRVFNVPTTNTVIPVVCYASCEACTTPGEFYDVTFQVDASQLTVAAEGIHIAGNFNGFTPAAMTNTSGTIWTFTTSIEEGSTMIWKYLNGNSFDNVETVPAECGNDDGFGGFNRITTGPGQNTVLDVVCFGSCSSSCEAAPCTASGGTLSTTSPRSYCVGSGQPQFCSVEVTGASGTNQRWALIQEDGLVIASRSNNSLFNLDQFAPGNYTIRYMRFEPGVDVGSVGTVADVANLTGCFSVSSNAINIFTREEPSGGTLTATNSTTVCAGAGAASIVQVALTGASGEFSRYGIVSQALGNQVVGNQANTNVNFSSYAPGTYRIFHISYQQGVSLAGVQFQSDLEGCYDLSNPVVVTVASCLSAEMSSLPNPTTGSSFVTFTNPREEYATLEVYDMSGRMVQRLFNQMTQPDREYRMEFNGQGLPNGVYLYRLTTESDVVVDKFMIAR